MSTLGEDLRHALRSMARTPVYTLVWMTVVGVVGDVNDGPLGSRPSPQVHVPCAQIRDGELEEAASADSRFGRVLIAAVKSPADAGALAREVRSVVQQLDAALPVTSR